MVTSTDKYVVIKWEEWDKFLRLHGGAGGLELPEMLTDAHVIREQDIFAYPVFNTYASVVQTVIETLGMTEQAVPEYLYEARDHFFAAAEMAHAAQVKFPDA